MSSTTINEYTKVPMPKINILRIRKLLENNYKVDHDLAEGIAEAIDTAFQDQDIDTDAFATKSDINDIKSDVNAVKSDLNNLRIEMYHLLLKLGIGLGSLVISMGAALAWYIQFLIDRF
jgi:hypothetical protein